MITSWIILAICAGVGFCQAFEWVASQLATKQTKPFARLTLVALCCLALAPLIFWYPILQRSHHLFADDFAQNMYQNVPPGSVIIGAGDFFQSLTSYTHEVTGLRQDTTPITLNLFYIFPWYRQNLRLHSTLTISPQLENLAKTVTIDGPSQVIEQLVADNPQSTFFITPLVLRDSIIAGTTQ